MTVQLRNIVPQCFDSCNCPDQMAVRPSVLSTCQQAHFVHFYWGEIYHVHYFIINQLVFQLFWKDFPIWNPKHQSLWVEPRFLSRMPCRTSHLFVWGDVWGRVYRCWEQGFLFYYICRTFSNFDSLGIFTV